jgi:hypothetical protein
VEKLRWYDFCWSADAERSIKSPDGQSLYEVAQKSGHPEIAEMVKEA